MKNSGTIAIDLDGVIFNLEEEACDRFGYWNRFSYSFFDRYPDIDPEIIEEFFQSPGIYENLMVLTGGVFLVNTVKELGFEVLFITSRGTNTEKVTRNSLLRIGFENIPVLYSKNKGEFITHWNLTAISKIRMLVDDNPKAFEDLPHEVVGICWEQLWNGGVYPRGRYNHELQRLEIKTSPEMGWRQMWKTEDKK